jgi:hypothetical protein
LARLQNVCGNKQQRIEQLDDDIAKCSVGNISKWPECCDKMKNLLTRRNKAPGMLNNETESAMNMFSAYGQCVEQQAADTADQWFDPSSNNDQQSDAASQQLQAQYAEQEAATVQAATADTWQYTGNENYLYQMYTQWTTIEPALGWPGSAAAAMAT